ncbi:4-hydroxyproline epimerase [Muriicola soli]|uniref:4-hydroxyproline epimerase n=1 Tax=Muriicola soli TaxID=2507538 RepID=A0A411E911_9FLAO|nr:4-hydroxyproline epimerase [Muriicola soli]QBA63950.1 4-hydroxyproline epimerase [Muriicola soli]
MASHTFYCVDGHTCGNPVRLVVKGGPPLTGKTMSEKRQHFVRKFDWIRKGLMFEPRGHDMMSGSILYPPSDPENDFGILFIETSGCLPMCGHGAIGTITMAIEEKVILPKNQGTVRMETPAGLIIASYSKKGSKVNWVKLQNVPSYLAAEDLVIECPVLGSLTFDVAYGGNFYAIIDPQKNYKGLEHYSAAQLVQLSPEIRKRINEKYPNHFIHPENDTIRDVSHLMWTGEPRTSEASGRNAVFYGDKAIDRSPCGTGTSARLAQWYARGRIKAGQEFIHESIIGSTFTATIEGVVSVGSYPAIIPGIKGWAKNTGYNRITLDEDDPYVCGFQVV